jgi:hypothetical protein
LHHLHWKILNSDFLIVTLHYNTVRMTENEKLLHILVKAAKAAQRKALRKGIPYAISVNGKIEYVHPRKKSGKTARRVKKAVGSRGKRKAK